MRTFQRNCLLSVVTQGFFRSWRDRREVERDCASRYSGPLLQGGCRCDRLLPAKILCSSFCLQELCTATATSVAPSHKPCCTRRSEDTKWDRLIILSPVLRPGTFLRNAANNLVFSKTPGGYVSTSGYRTHSFFSKSETIPARGSMAGISTSTLLGRSMWLEASIKPSSRRPCHHIRGR